MFCTNCGNQIEDNVQACPFCGVAVNGSSVYQENTQWTGSEISVKSKKKINPKKIGVVAAAFVAFIALVAIISNATEASKFKKAIKDRDAAYAYQLYVEAYDDADKKAKYDKIVGETLDKIIDIVKEKDFSKDAETNENVVYEYIEEEYGTLLTSDNISLSACITTKANTAKWELLADTVADQLVYCKGVYAYNNAQDETALKTAITNFAKVDESARVYKEAQEMIATCTTAYLEKMLEKVDEYILKDDLSGAIELLTNIKTDFENMGLEAKEVEDLLKETMTTYGLKYAEKATVAFANKDIQATIGHIEAALQICPDNSEFLAKKQEYLLYLPHPLYKESNCLKVEKFDGNNGTIKFDETLTANDGTEMPYSIRWYDDNADYTKPVVATYNLAGKYDIVSGKMFLLDYDKNTNLKGYFKVFGDGAEIYTSPELTGGVLPQDITFSVTGVQTLTIHFFAQADDRGWRGCYGPDFGISNFVAQKSFPETTTQTEG